MFRNFFFKLRICQAILTFIMVSQDVQTFHLEEQEHVLASFNIFIFDVIYLHNRVRPNHPIITCYYGIMMMS